MSELDDWAAETGYKISQPTKVGAWFDDNPERLGQVKEARERGWSWLRIAEFLRTKGFPFTANPMQEECAKRGIR